jgi:O-acetyl-ADP-ribose deacetylase
MSTSEYIVHKTVVRLIKGDITDLDLDAIVNAANSSLLGGGGVDGAIHQKGGPRILEECRAIRERDWPNGLPTGKAVITSGGMLKAKHVIHTVGPVWHGGKRGESDLLATAYRSSLELASANRLKSLAFPSISTGAYGFPIELAGRIALKIVKAFLEIEEELREVVFALFSDSDFDVYVSLTDEIFVLK